MRIASQHILIQQANELAARRGNSSPSKQISRTDIIDVESARAEARAADMDVRQTQNTMTLFRIAEGALDKIETAAARFGELAGAVATGELTASEINTAAVEAVTLFAAMTSASEGATMGGVPIFGKRADTEQLWGIAAGNANALGTNKAGDDIEATANAGEAALALRGVKVTDPEAMGLAFEATEQVSVARKLMDSQASKLGSVVLDLTADAIRSLSAAARSTDAYAHEGLMKFIRENAIEETVA